MDYDATSLYPSANWDDKFVYPFIESGLPFELQMNSASVGAFNNQSLNQNGIESAFLGIKYRNPENLVFQHIGVKEKINNHENNRMRNGHFTVVLTLVDVQEIVKSVGKSLKFRKVVSIE